MKDKPQPFLTHLEELRRRIFIVLTVWVVLFIGSMFYVDKIIEIFSQQTGGFVFLHPTEALFARLKIAFVVALFLSIPVIIFEVWRFVGIGLTPGERRKTLVFLPISYLLFCGGVAVAWFGVLPFAIQFLLGFETETLQPFLSIDRYIGFVAWFSMAFGVMFQLPIVIFLLVKIGVVTPKQLARYRPHVILGLAILAALLTPGPDFFSQLALLIPTYLLFEISLLAARLTSK